jgi:hypothetical protein
MIDKAQWHLTLEQKSFVVQFNVPVDLSDD